MSHHDHVSLAAMLAEDGMSVSAGGRSATVDLTAIPEDRLPAVVEEIEAAVRRVAGPQEAPVTPRVSLN